MTALAHLYYKFEIGSFDELEGDFCSKHYQGKMIIEKNAPGHGTDEKATHLIFGFDSSRQRIQVGTAREKPLRSTKHPGETFLACRLSFKECRSYPFSVFHGEVHAAAYAWPARIWQNFVRVEKNEDENEENSE
mgnify:CR=1 FL=1